jgi:hypothetical protein
MAWAAAMAAAVTGIGLIDRGGSLISINGRAAVWTIGGRRCRLRELAVVHKTVPLHRIDTDGVTRVAEPAALVAAQFGVHLIGLSVTPPVYLPPTGIAWHGHPCDRRALQNLPQAQPGDERWRSRLRPETHLRLLRLERRLPSGQVHLCAFGFSQDLSAKPFDRGRRHSLRQVERGYEARRRPDHPGMIRLEGPQSDEPPQDSAPAQLVLSP